MDPNTHSHPASVRDADPIQAPAPPVEQRPAPRFYQCPAARRLADDYELLFRHFNLVMEEYVAGDLDKLCEEFDQIVDETERERERSEGDQGCADGSSHADRYEIRPGYPDCGVLADPEAGSEVTTPDRARRAPVSDASGCAGQPSDAVRARSDPARDDVANFPGLGSISYEIRRAVRWVDALQRHGDVPDVPVAVGDAWHAVRMLQYRARFLQDLVDCTSEDEKVRSEAAARLSQLPSYREPGKCGVTSPAWAIPSAPWALSGDWAAVSTRGPVWA